MLPLKQFQDFIEQESLFKKNDKVLLAVSGGRDSVLMLHLFQALKIEVAVAHCNFNLRAGESQRDETFVKLLCETFGVPCYVTHFDTKKYAALHKISTQMAARELRYQWFEELRSTGGYQYIALAQHQDDVVETMLINLVRGTGISGLHGILPKRGFLIRPLLFLNRAEIDALVAEHHIEFVEDSSNESTAYTRNKIRLDVIPHLKMINPNLEKTFRENSERFAAAELFLQAEVQKTFERIFVRKAAQWSVMKADIKMLHPTKLLLFELLKPFGFISEVVEEILNALDGSSGKQFFSESHQVTINREELLLNQIEVSEPNEFYLTREMGTLKFKGYILDMSFSDEVKFEALKHRIFVDADHLIFPLRVRSWQNGDRFKPMGMTNFKNISDFFIDEKVALPQKKQIPLLVNGNGELIWIAGMRQDNRYKISKSTKKVAIFEVKIN